MATADETFHSHIIQMTIRQVSKLKSVVSSEVFIHGIPSKAVIFKTGIERDDNDGGGGEDDDDNEEDKPSLASKLICANTDKSFKWSLSGSISCKLVPFNKNDALEKNMSPDVFSRTLLDGGRYYDIIQWDDLFDENNKYVMTQLKWKSKSKQKIQTTQRDVV